jgi:uncharacterized membrane protein (DUF373 family)
MPATDDRARDDLGALLARLLPQPQSGPVTAPGSGRRVGGTGEQVRRQPLRAVLRLFRHAETVLHASVAIVLVLIATAALIHTVAHLTLTGNGFLAGVLNAINGVLLVVIVLEILRTVLAHFTEEGFPLHDFLVIGIISATRHILTVAVRLTVSQASRESVTLSLLELLASAGVVLGLVVALFVVSRSGPVERA